MAAKSELLEFSQVNLLTNEVKRETNTLIPRGRIHFNLCFGESVFLIHLLFFNFLVKYSK